MFGDFGLGFSCFVGQSTVDEKLADCSGASLRTVIWQVRKGRGLPEICGWVADYSCTANIILSQWLGRVLGQGSLGARHATELIPFVTGDEYIRVVLFLSGTFVHILSPPGFCLASPRTRDAKQGGQRSAAVFIVAFNPCFYFELVEDGYWKFPGHPKPRPRTLPTL